MLSDRGAPRGYTLIEVVVAMAIVAVLASLALPGFDGLLRRTRRADALVAVMHVSTAQERHRGQAPSYGTLAEIGIGERSANGHYGLQILSRDANGFELLASAVGAQARDTECRYMRLLSRHLTPIYASGATRDLANGPSANRRCWHS